MVDVSHDDETEEQFDTDVRVPGVAFDIGQKGFPKVLVVQKIADSVAEYDGANNDGDDAKKTTDYAKNVLVRTRPDDAVYQVVYLTDGPLGRTDFNDPKSRYPIPESRLFPFRHWKADPVDNSGQYDPREVVQADTLEALFDVAHAFDDAPDADALEAMAEHAGLDNDVVQRAREAADAHATLSEGDEVALDDSDGPDMELKRVGEGDEEPDVTPVGKAPDKADDPPEPPEDGGHDSVDDVDDEQLGDFDPSDEL